MSLLSNIKRTVGKVKNKVNGTLDWDMSTKEGREIQAKRDFEYAKVERAEQTEKMKELNNYYNNDCYSSQQIAALAQKYNWESTPPSIPYAFIHVESQIDDVVPQFQFKGRDNDLDSERAKVREDVVNYVWYNNKVAELNMDNERILREIGNAFFKVSWDGSIVVTPFIMGDIVIGNPDPGNIFNQPGAYDVEDSEWIIYAFRMHRRKARRTFGAIIDSITNDNDHATTEIYDNITRSVDDDSMQVVEYWYRDDEGDPACSIQVNNVEVKWIKKYWKNTRLSGNKMFPIIKYCDTPVRKSFWDRGEIETIQDLIDAANRELYTAILNDLFCANDFIIYEKDALVSEPSTMPGAHWIVKQGMINSVRRMGGMQANTGLVNMIEFLQQRMEDTNGNYAARGAEPVRIDTASGFAQLREDRDQRFKVKSAGRMQGYARLAELCDWTALEFYNQERMVVIRGKDDAPDTSFPFNSENERIITRYEIDPETGMEIPMEYYYPKVDVEISAGDGVRKSKATTLAATQELSQMPITPENYGIVLSIVDLLDLPNKQDVKNSIMAAMQRMVAPQAPQDPTQAIMSNLSPEEQAQFQALPPEEQQAMLAQVQGGG